MVLLLSCCCCLDRSCLFSVLTYRGTLEIRRSFQKNEIEEVIYLLLPSRAKNALNDDSLSACRSSLLTTDEDVVVWISRIF